MKPIIVKKNDTFTNPFNHDKETMTLIKFMEPTRVGDYSFNNYHYYDMDKNHKLHQWFKKPFYNQESDYKKYRNAYGLLSPKQVQQLINHYDFSLRELATILGMSPATLSNIKQGKYIQSASQNNLLMNMTNPISMFNLIQRNLNRIKITKPKINHKHFNKCIKHVQNMCSPNLYKQMISSDISFAK